MKKLIRITTVPISLDKLLGKQLTFVNHFFDVTAISSKEKELKKVAAKYGVKHHYIEMTRTISPLKDISAVWALYRFLRIEKPDIVHSHTPKAGIVGMTAAWLAGVPFRLHTVAGLPLMETSGFKRRLLNFVEKQTYRFATKVYPNSFGLQKIILDENFCALEKLKVIAQGSTNGIDTSFFSTDQISENAKNDLRSKLGINSDDFVYIFVGRLVGDKGLNELINAFKSINLSKMKLLLVGNFEYDLDPLHSISLKEINENKNIISVVFKEDVRPYFGISDALVFPSYREGFPNVVLQAGSMGLPSIVSDINGCNEIIINEQNGLIIPAKNTELLAVAMYKLIENSSLRTKLQNSARAVITKNYEQRFVWDAILAEYKMLIKDL